LQHYGTNHNERQVLEHLHRTATKRYATKYVADFGNLPFSLPHRAAATPRYRQNLRHNLPHDKTPRQKGRFCRGYLLRAKFMPRPEPVQAMQNNRYAASIKPSVEQGVVAGMCFHPTCVYLDKAS
jgi:hypothetical protein